MIKKIGVGLGIPPFISTGVGGGGGDAYTGPLDLVSGAVVANGPRALSAAMVEQPLYTLRRSGDDATLSFNSDASGDSPVSAIISWRDALGAADAFFTIWNDQSSNDFDAAPTSSPAEDPPWVSSITNDRPGASPTDASQLLAAAPIAGGQATFFWVLNFEVPTDTFAIQSSNNLTIGTEFNIASDVWVSMNTSEGSVDWVTSGIVTAGAHILEIVIASDGAVTVLFDGVDMAAAIESGVQATFSDSENTLIIPLTNNNLQFLERIAWPTALAAGDRLAIRQNQATYYGITLS